MPVDPASKPEVRDPIEGLVSQIDREIMDAKFAQLDQRDQRRQLAMICVACVLLVGVMPIIAAIGVGVWAWGVLIGVAYLVVGWYLYRLSS